jgi:hypothetical protein
MFSVVMLSVAVRPNRLNVVLLSVVAPSQPTFFRKDFKTFFHFLAYKFLFPLSGADSHNSLTYVLTIS